MGISFPIFGSILAEKKLNRNHFGCIFCFVLQETLDISFFFRKTLDALVVESKKFHYKRQGKMEIPLAI